MARFETFVPDDRAAVFGRALWEFIGRLGPCDVPVAVVHSYPAEAGKAFVIEFEDQKLLNQFAEIIQTHAH